MKKIYLAGLAALFATGVYGQQTIKVKIDTKNTSELKRVKSTENLRGANPNNSPLQVAGTVVCNTGYVAGSTMNLIFTIHTTNIDAEYMDSLAITFPAGFTVNTSSAATFPTADAGGGAEALNGVSGQVISWGINNNDKYGGIWANPAQTFDVNVTIGSGVTGNQMAYFFGSGDTFGSTPGDWADSIQINPLLAVDAKLVSVQNIGISCDLTNAEMLMASVRNNGGDTIKGFIASYKINGGTAVVENPTDTILPGDTLTYMFTTPADLSAAGKYNIWVGTTLSLDGNLANDSASIKTENYTAYNVTGGAETMGFETVDSTLLSYWLVKDANADGATWALINTFNHSGARCLRKPGSGTTDDDWLFSNCLDLVSGTAYRLEYWYKNYDLLTPCSLEVAIGLSPAVVSMTQSIVQNPIPTDTLYQNVVISFTVTASGTYNLGFHAYATSGTSSIRIDDINLTEIPVGVKENTDAKNILIYPNPSNGMFYINVNSHVAQVEVYNFIGEKMFTKTQLAKGVNSIDLSDLHGGSYMVRITDGTEIINRKITVIK